jgi:hypothetical protein
MPKSHERCLGVAGADGIWLNLEAIDFYAPDNASRSAAVWRRMLKTSFHEFAHIALGHLCIPNRENKNDWDFHEYIENKADIKAEEWIWKVLENNGRLYQPDFLGIVDIIRRRRESKWRKQNPKYIGWRSIKNARCYITGGQLSVSDVASTLLENSFKMKRHQAFRIIHQFGDDLARIHIDSAKRRHHFWIWGDLPLIAQRLLDNGKLRDIFNKREADGDLPTSEDCLF